MYKFEGNSIRFLYDKYQVKMIICLEKKTNERDKSNFKFSVQEI